MIGMLDGLVLQVVLAMLLVIAAVMVTVWYVHGITKKSAVWIVAVFVPLAVAAAVVWVVVVI